MKITVLAKNNKLFSVSLGLFAVSLVLDLAGTSKPGLRTFAHFLIAATCLVAVTIIARQLVEKIRFGSWGVNVLAPVAVVTALLLKDYWTAVIVLLVYLATELIEAYARRRVKFAGAAGAQIPPTVLLLRGRKQVEVQTPALHRGNKIIIEQGAVVPVDCVIISGEGTFGAAFAEGEGAALPKTKGDELLAGQTTVSGAVIARVLRSGDQSHHHRVIKTLRGAVNSQAPFSRLADRFVIPFSLMAFMLAVAVWSASGELRRFLEVLAVATPAGLMLGASLSLIGGISRAANRGIIIKHAAAVERLANLRSLAFRQSSLLDHNQLPDVQELLKRLHKAGVKNTLMITSDKCKQARQLADSLGASTVRTESQPGEELNLIEGTPNKQRPIGFVGRGDEDELALAAADVGIGVGADEPLAGNDPADIVIKNDGPLKIAEAIELAQRTMAIGRRSVMLGTALSFALMALFATGQFRAYYGAALPLFIALAVTASAMRARR